MNRCVIIAGGELTDPEYIASLIEHSDYIICADKGLEYARKMKLKPDMLVGDFDSTDLPDNSLCETIVLPCVKDDTDTGFAVKQAILRGYRHILLLCCTGGRLDHTVANLQLMLYCSNMGADAEIEDESAHIKLLCRGGARLFSDYGKTFSLFSVSRECAGVNVSGAKYDLKDAELTNSFPLGISNEISGEYADVSLSQGIILLIHNRNV